MKCPNCRTEVLPDNRFCPICGTVFQQAQHRAPPTPRAQAPPSRPPRGRREPPQRGPKGHGGGKKRSGGPSGGPPKKEGMSPMLCPSCDNVVMVPKTRPITVSCKKCGEEYYLT